MPNKLMRAALLTEPHQIGFCELPLPEPGPGQVRLQMKLASICGSDVHLYRGDWTKTTPYPVRPGHEGIGYIDALGEGVTWFSLGQRIVIEPNFPCGQCKYCWQGNGNICPNKRITGVTEPGCFADYIVLPAQFAWPLPEHINDEDAVLIEPTAVAMHALRISQAQPGETIAVIGLGAIGMLLTHIAVRQGYTVLVTDRLFHKIELAERFGAIRTNVVDNAEPATQLVRQWDEFEVAAVFECTGSATATALAIEAAPRGAEVVLVGLSSETVSFNPVQLTRNGNNILTSMIYDHPDDFGRTIGLIAGGIIEPRQVISRRYKLAEIATALEKVSKGDEIKVILDI
ncbi:MAG TPA: alcohol dehydrogenase catalytic domain-containing protein [Anaerolineae bacterium]|nr:alcohol dehydrogenase catalytic domain-containing protein [Anaerolineae bacterium]